MMVTSAYRSGMSPRDRHSGLRRECKRQTLPHLAGCWRFGVTEGHCPSDVAEEAKDKISGECEGRRDLHRRTNEGRDPGKTVGRVH